MCIRLALSSPGAFPAVEKWRSGEGGEEMEEGEERKVGGEMRDIASS